MSNTIKVAGLLANTREKTHLLIAFPDGSSLSATGDRAKGIQQLNYFPSAAGPLETVQARIAAVRAEGEDSLEYVHKPCTVEIDADLTPNHADELANAFVKAVRADAHRAEYRNLRAFGRAYESQVYNGTGDGSQARRARRRVEDRDLALTIDEEVLHRPNGEQYLPRTLVGHTDAAVLRRGREHSMYALLRGEPGTGKTALADAVFPDLIPFSCTGDTTVAHLAGSYMPNPDGTFRWQDGPLTVAMKEGRVFLADEIDRLPHEVSAVLHSAMDGRRMLRLDDRPDLPPVQAADGFYVIGTYNPRNLGGKPLPEAILSRFPLQIEVDTDFDAAEVMGVPERFVSLARNLCTQARRAVADGGEPVWYPQMRELLAAKRFVDAGFGESFALASVIDSCPVPEDLEKIRHTARDVFGERPESMRLGRRA